MQNTPQSPYPIYQATYQKTSNRAKIFGILNFLAAAFFVFITIAQISSLSTISARSITPFIMILAYVEIAVSIFCAAALLAGGIFLLQKRILGRTLTRLTGFVGAGFIILFALGVFITTSGIQFSYALGLVLGVTFRFLYSFVATRMLMLSPEVLGLS
ncbi:MAG: hypothetical protein HGA86_06395 [Anaerolineaceae bacterium]|nr:hypothetical protein [Anaerolineaceae bacterium]